MGIKNHWERLLGAALLVGLAGCEASNGTITGTVRFQGEPLKSGYVAFVSASQPGVRIGATIESDGTYRIRGCPPGPAQITVQADPPRGHKSGGAGLPARYRSTEKSNLTYTVLAGTQEHNIDLVP